MHQEQQYLGRLKYLTELCNERDNRTDTNTVGFFGGKLVFDLSGGELPLLTTKHLNLHYIVAELEWFLTGSGNAHQLIKRSCPIWNEWMKPLKNYSDDVHCNDRPLMMVNVKKLSEGFHRVVIPDLKDCMKSSGEEITSAYARHRFTADDIMTPSWIKDLWLQLLNQSYFNVAPNSFTGSKVMSDMGIRGMVPEWFDFSTFLEDIKKLDNFALAELSHKSAETYTGRLKHVMTGLYNGASIMGPDSALFLHKNEIKEYLHQEQYGVLKVHFKDAAYGKVTPMYLMNDDDVSSRIHKSLTVDHIERIGSKELGARRLRYAKSYGDLGPIYGVQWRGRSKEYVDQIEGCIKLLKNDPHNRRIIVDSWNVSQLAEMALPPCHLLFQFYMEEIDPLTASEALQSIIVDDKGNGPIPKYKISIQVYQR